MISFIPKYPSSLSEYPSFDEQLSNQPGQPKPEKNGKETLHTQRELPSFSSTDLAFFPSFISTRIESQRPSNISLEETSQVRITQVNQVLTEEKGAAPPATYSEARENEWLTEEEIFFADMEDLFNLLSKESEKNRQIQKKIQLNLKNIKLIEMSVQSKPDDQKLIESLNWFNQRKQKLHQEENTLCKNRWGLIYEKIESIQINLFDLYQNINSENQQLNKIWNEIYSKLENCLQKLSKNHSQNPSETDTQIALALLIKGLYTQHNLSFISHSKKEVNENFSKENEEHIENLENIFKKIFPLINPSIYADIIYDDYQNSRKSQEETEKWQIREEIKDFLSGVMRDLRTSINKLEKKEKPSLSNKEGNEALPNYIDWMDNLFHKLLEINKESVLPLFKIPSKKGDLRKTITTKEMYRQWLPNTYDKLRKIL